MSSQTLQIATTIKSQISINELWAIGATKFIAIAPSEKYDGGLQFQASLFGKKKCTVIILLNGKDLYNIAVFTGSKLKYVGGAKDVFCENLTYAIVSNVEKYFAS
jgi:hypothetical protein